ncbi:hypothetical protein ACJX0J_024798, partial [Zea mays]
MPEALIPSSSRFITIFSKNIILLLLVLMIFLDFTMEFIHGLNVLITCKIITMFISDYLLLSAAAEVGLSQRSKQEGLTQEIGIEVAIAYQKELVPTSSPKQSTRNWNRSNNKPITSLYNQPTNIYLIHGGWNSTTLVYLTNMLILNYRIHLQTKGKELAEYMQKHKIS